MRALILAAGYATRLYPLTLDKPKCLLTVGGKTLLDTLCEKLQALETLDEIIIVTNNKFYAQLLNWERNASSRVPVRILNDGTLSNDTRLGAIGDLDFAITQCGLRDDLLVLAGDNLFDAGLQAFVSFSKTNESAVCVGLYDIGDPQLASKKFGVLEVDSSWEVTGIEEKPDHPKSSLIGMGVYYFPKASLGFVKKYLQSPDAKDAPGHYVRWLLGRLRIFGFRFLGMWYDIGDLKALEDANRSAKGL